VSEPEISDPSGRQPAGLKKPTDSVVRLVLPSALTLGLFFVATFFIALPAYTDNLLNHKKQAIRELTAVAWSVVNRFYQEEQAGLLGRQEAQAQALATLRDFRYDNQGTGYFWVNDFTPVLLMHPHRRDLEGQDLGSYADPNGTRLFSAFVDLVKAHDEGYVPYIWQWNSDPSRLVPKLSFVKGFAPWRWIIGTGIYLDDVEAEARQLTRTLVWEFAAIFLLVVALSAYMVRDSVRNNRRMRAAEEQVVAYQVNLQRLVEERTASLEKALVEVKTLSGLLPICASCKNIRDDHGYWTRIEKYLSDHSSAVFTHGICPECRAKLYPDLPPTP
jgi:hypothetical protein